MQSSATISFEFFPPKTEQGQENFVTVARKFSDYNPDFYSVTFGANGSSQDGTKPLVAEIYNSTGISTAPHISCIGTDKTTVKCMLDEYKAIGINRLVVLRGDVLDKSSYIDFHYANELVDFIRATTGDYFHISVAAYPEYHPESVDPYADFQHFINKIRSGSDQAITQYFYNPDAYFYFVDSCLEKGIKTPIIPGIMPITNYKQLIAVSDRCKAEIPSWIRAKLAYYDAKGDLMGLREFGEQVVTLQCETLLNNNATGLHFYTLNKFEPSHNILQNLMLSSNKNQSIL